MRNFEITCEPFEVTSLNRPDERWEERDSHGHLHHWVWPNGSREYDPASHAEVFGATLTQTGVEYDEEGEEYPVREYLCNDCREAVQPRYTADSTRRFVPGLRSFYIDGEPVSKEVFEREARADGLLK